MADNSKMQMYEAQAMLIERERELQEAQREIQQLRLDNAQQRIDQAIAVTERKFEEQLAEMRRQFETLTGVTTALKESIEQSTEENKIEARRLLEREREDRVTTERNFQNQLAEVGRQMAREREDRVAAVRNIEAQFGEKEETIDGIRQHFETQIETLQRRIDEQSGEIENLIIGQLERVNLVEKANEETKTMVKNTLIQLENVYSEVGFHSSALIVGGLHDNISNSICIFDSKENKWRTCKQGLPFKVKQHGSAILNGKIYFMGGENNPNEPLASCYKLGENGEWDKMADMNEKRVGISQSTIVFGSEIWVIGGWNGSDSLKTVEKYNPQTNIWTKIPSSASMIGGKIFVSGGWDGKKRLKSVEVYDPAKDKWEIFCDMPFELDEHCSIVEGANLIIIGGEKFGRTPLDEVWKIDIFDPKKEWIRIPSLKQGRCEHGAVKLSNGIMVFGGEIDGTTQIDSVEIFDGISWKEGLKLPEKNGLFSSIPLSIKTEKQLLLQLC